MKIIYIYKLIAYFVKYFTNTRYSFYKMIKNKNIVVKGKIKYSNSKILLDIGDFIQYYIFMDGAYEVESLDFIASLVEGKIFIDIGANVGNYPLSLHKKAKRIYAFEASKNNLHFFTENIRVNQIDNIEIFNYAVGAEDYKKINLYLSPDTGGNNSIYEKFSGEYESVDTISLDTFCKVNKIEGIDIIKIDVEGSEFDVIKGASKVIREFRPLFLIEFSSSTARSAGYRLLDLYSYLTDLYYEAFRIKDGVLMPIQASLINNDLGFQENLVFVHMLHRKKFSPASSSVPAV